MAWFQGLWALAYVIRPGRWLSRLAIVVNAATVVTWIWAHVIGLPFGPTTGQVEPATITDVRTTLFELGLVVWLVASSRHVQGGDAARLPMVVLVAVVAAVAFGTGVALAQPM